MAGFSRPATIRRVAFDFAVALAGFMVFALAVLLDGAQASTPVTVLGADAMTTLPGLAHGGLGQSAALVASGLLFASIIAFNLWFVRQMRRQPARGRRLPRTPE